MTAVPFYDVRAANAPYRGQFAAVSQDVLDSGHLIAGPRLDAFEKEFAAYCGVNHCVGVGTGLDGLTLALRAVGVMPGDEVIVPAFTFIATWFAVSNVGAVPVPVDVGVEGNIDVGRIEAAITPRTRAIVPVHLFGRVADMSPLMALAAAYNLRVVEDAAQAHGAVQSGRRAGSLGDAAAFSFYPTKNLGALGDGGCVCTDDFEVAMRVRRLRNYGALSKYEHDTIGTNSRLDELQAAFLTVKLGELDQSNARRREVARFYLAALEPARLRGLDLPAGPPEDSVWHLFVVRAGRRELLRQALAERGVGTMVHYPAAPFEQPCYAGRYDARDYPVAAALGRTVLSLPMADYLSDADVVAVTQAVLASAAEHCPAAA